MKNIGLCLLLLSGCGGGAGRAAPAAPAALSSALDTDADAVVSGTLGALNLRVGPSTSFAVLETLPEGARVHVDAAADNGYFAVTHAGRSGFAYGSYLRNVPPAAAAGALQAAVDRLSQEAPLRSPGSEIAIAVKDLTTGEYAAVADGVLHVSASAAKPIWVAAALDGVGVAAVSPLAAAIFQNSDNYASGSAIDLVGPNAVNDFYWRSGMTSSALTQWSFGRTRVATNSPRALGSDNYFTAADVVTFLARLDAGTLLSADGTAALDGWLTWTPRSGYGGWAGSDLPAAARATLRHKAGWLPPGCCGDDTAYNTLNEMALVQTPDGHRLAVALLTRHGRDYWGAQAPFVEHAVCALYAAASGDPAADCR